MRKEIYKIKNPKHIVFGDPLYFEDFKGAELKRLTVDYKPPKSFDAARLVLLEKPNEKYPEYTDRTMTLYLAPRQTIDIYADEKIYAFQKIDGKSIGVDKLTMSSNSSTLFFLSSFPISNKRWRGSSKICNTFW